MTWGDNSGDDYPGKIQQCMIYNATPDANYDAFPLYAGCFNYPYKFYRSMIGFEVKADLVALGAVSVSAATLYFYPTEINGSHNISLYRCVQGWLEAECTFNIFKTGSNWHTAGCSAADDAAVDDDDSFDRFATPVDTQFLDGVGSYSLVFDVTSIVQQWFSGSVKEYGLHYRSDNEAINTRCIVAGTPQPDGQRPYLVIDYSVPSFLLTGSVSLLGAPVIRTVNCYIRSTGALYDSVESKADGSFELGAPDGDTEMFVIALPDGNGEDYNALVFDRVKGLPE